MPAAQAFERTAEPRLRVASGIAGAGIEQGHAAVDRRMHDANRFRLAERRLAPVTGAAEADLRDAQTGAAERTIEHRRNRAAVLMDSNRFPRIRHRRGEPAIDRES